MDSKTRALRKDYDKLTAHERFRLVLAACERDDLGEVEALARACPRKLYEDMDYQYTERMRVLWTVVDSYLLMQLSAQVIFWRLLGMSETDHFMGLDETGERASDIAWSLMDVMSTYRLAFGQLCDELGITPGQALQHSPSYKLAGIVKGELDLMDGLLDGIATPDDDAAVGWKATWLQFWNMRLDDA